MTFLTREAPRPAVVRDRPGAWMLAVVTVCFGAFMGQLDASVVTLTYRPLERAFGVGPAGVQWVSLAYLLVLAALLAPAGRRSDRAGRKLSYIQGFTLFTAASALCGLAPDFPALLACRALQAVGAAMLQANSVALVARVAPPDRLRTALGAQAGAQALGLALGPTAGGLIVATVGWRWVFAVNVPFGLMAVAAAVVFLPRTHERAGAGRADGPGVALLAASTGALLLLLSALGGLRLPGLLLWALGPLAVAAAAGLLWRQRVARAPVLARRVLAAPGVGPGLVAALAAYLVLFGPLVFVPAGLEATGRSALFSGLIVTALPAGFALAATTAGWLLPRSWGDRRRAGAGAALTVVALAAAAADPLGLPGLVVWLVAVGAGLGTLAPANNAEIMRAAPPDTAASAGGVLNTTRSLGTAIGVSVVTVAVHVGGARAATAALAAVALLALGVLVGGARRPARTVPLQGVSRPAPRRPAP